MYNDLINSFVENKDPEKASQMAAYMKSQFPFLGIQKPKRVLLGKEYMKEFKRQEAIDWDFVSRLWSMSEREFQYLAVDYLLALRDSLQEKDIDNIGNLIVTKSWWDTIDTLATRIVGPMCFQYPQLISSNILKWSKGDNIWLIRTAILFQLKYKEKTDAELLGLIIKENSGTNEFFINKAIGWALREYSKTNKSWVEEFIKNNTLSSLSVREGSKYLLSRLSASRY
ncbi:DNA alkylation repair protein [Tissierella creatinini]|nr:DNA alkylation repair protein [Tissierella creatinini]TJX60136.1 DNA alkylation repair protein [Soehngenia saccharolytica]